MKVRSFTPGDAAALIELHSLSVQELNEAFYSADELAAWIGSWSVEQVVEAARRCDDYLVAEEEGEVLGFGCRREDELLGLYVHPLVAGQGVGSLLLKELLARIQEEGFLCVRAESSLGAQGFYEKRGFVAVKKSTLELSGVKIPCVFLQKVL